MMTTSKKPLYVYLQRPDSGEWVTVGRYFLQEDEVGTFFYAPSYVDAGLTWSIDPVNLPFIPDTPLKAIRYHGLHDILRDACPDSWGKVLIQRKHGLSQDEHDSVYLKYASNTDRWGALAIGSSPKPSVSVLNSPKLFQLEVLTEELLAMYERRPAVSRDMRKQLMSTPSMGGARPKATVQDGDVSWLVKPALPSDTVDVPLLEYAIQVWATRVGLHFAPSQHLQVKDGLSVLLVRRFDRVGERRLMTISAASMLSTEYPGKREDLKWSYPRLAEELKRIGAPPEDRIELFDRMVFNAVIGNDDDHPRNHAAVFDQQHEQWRLSPAFDVVPNTDFLPAQLTMQLSVGSFEITRKAVLADAQRFGFKDNKQAQVHLDSLLIHIEKEFEWVKSILTNDLQVLMQDLLKHGLSRLTKA